MNNTIDIGVCMSEIQVAMDVQLDSWTETQRALLTMLPQTYTKRRDIQRLFPEIYHLREF